MEKRKYIVIIVLILLFGMGAWIYLGNREYKYICFNMDISKDTLVVESYLDECTTNKRLSSDVITEKSELLMDISGTSYRLIRDVKEGEMLYKDDFVLYEAPRATETNIELLTEVEVMNHGNSSEEFTKYRTYIKNGKLYGVNLNTNEEKIIFDSEEVKNIAVRSICCTGNGQLLILTSGGNVYISEKDCNYSFSFNFPFKKLEVSDIVSFKLVPVNDNDWTKNLYGVNSKGEEILLQKLN